MASAMITVPTTASRFALLQVDSDSDSDISDRGKTTKDVRQDTGKNRPGKAAVGKAAQSNDKRKEKKKKKREQQQSQENELRCLAFKKLPQKPSCPSPLTLQGVAGELLHTATTDKAVPPEGWQQWKKRDEQITNDLYEADLEKALMMSKLEYEQEKQNDTDAATTKTCGGAAGGGKREKKKSQQGKDKKTTVSLQDFQAEGSTEQHGKRLEKEEHVPANPEVDQKMQFFNTLEDDVSKIVQREKRREQFSNSQYQQCSASSEYETDPRAEQLKDNLEKKDLEIVILKKTISAWEVRYKEVKARNTQLLKMLQQGEMKDKADILLQVEELLNIKEELSSQVTFLHASLEQEKSKVKVLQVDQPKHQGNKKAKKISETDL
ncbi:G kinase-anchoring protein 1 [Aplochiton taeniatus]